MARTGTERFLYPLGRKTTCLEKGEVIGNLANGRVRVKIPKSSDCSGCEHRKFCDPFGSEHMLVEAANELEAKTGQKVEVQMVLERRTKAIFILYILPLIFLVLGAVIGNALDPLGNKDLSSTVFCLGFVILAFAGIRSYAKRAAAKEPASGPRIVRILDSS